MKINRKAYFDNWRKHFGRLQQPLVNDLNFLLSKLETGLFKLPTQMAYILATAWHETAGTMRPVIEGYWIKTNRVQKLYNYYKQNNPGALRSIFPYGTSGLTYEGRGYVQLTHKWNYAKFGLIDNPDDAMQPETAFMIMEKGMANSLFTGKSLQDYVNETQTNFTSARKVINGMDRASLIAGYATKILQGIELVENDLAMQAYNETDYI